MKAGLHRLREHLDVIAPDGSEIRFLAATERASTVHCTLLSGGVSLAVRHRTVEEIWYCLEGRGEVWRSLEGEGEVCVFEPGGSLTIPLGAHFQFCNTGAEPLRFLIATMPPWPGEHEAVRVNDHWPTRSD